MKMKMKTLRGKAAGVGATLVAAGGVSPRPGAGEGTGLMAPVVDPRRNLEGFVVKDVIREMESAVTDAGRFYGRVERNERIRKCLWEGKHPSGRKVSKAGKKAAPWENAADHEVRLAQEVLLQLTAQRVAAMQRGSFNVTPMEGTDARAAAQMKLVMRYYLQTAMRSERLVQGARWAAWSLRYGHAVLYVGWKTVKGMEKVSFREGEVVEFVLGQLVAQMTAAGGGTEGQEVQGSMGQDGEEGMGMIQGEELRLEAERMVAEATEMELAGWLLEMFPQLRGRGKVADEEALRAAQGLRFSRQEGGGAESYFYASFVKEDRPEWEALRQGIDFFCPAETVHTDSFDGAPWLARVKWLNAAQIHEQAALRGWDQAWKVEVLAKCKGKARLFSLNTGKTPWALSGTGVGYATSLEAEKHLYQVVEYYDRRVTGDGVTCLYKTVLHPDVPDRVAVRELLEDWHGHYPFVPATAELDEPVLMENLGVPELVASAQNAVKTQWDSRDDMAGLTTMPPWTGPEQLRGIPIHPGAFIPEWSSGKVAPWTLPQPDGRSIEIEATLRTSVARYFGLISKEVPEALTMLLTQVGVDWFLAAYSRAIALTAQLVQQRMSRLTGARITGTEIVFDATREGVRGSFDFQVAFDVRALDIEWTKEILTFVQSIILPMDNREIVNRRVFIELGVNMIDPALADRAISSEEEVEAKVTKDEEGALNMIFSGGLPEFRPGEDHGARSQIMMEDLQRSPMRQQMLAGNEMVAAVWEDRLQKHLFQVEQEQNKVAGIEGGSDPLRQSPLARLKAGGWEAMLGG